MAKQYIDQEPDIPFYDVHEVIVPHLGHIPIVKGDFNRLPKKAQKFIAYYVSLSLSILTVNLMQFTCTIMVVIMVNLLTVYCFKTWLEKIMI